MPLLLELENQRYVHVEPLHDVAIIFGSAFFFFFLRRYCDRNVFEVLATMMKCPPKKVAKYKENAWYALYYIMFTVIGYLVLWNDAWIWDFNQIYGSYPTIHAKDSTANPLLRPYYLAELGFYVQALYTHFFIDSKLKDFHVLAIHHIVTIFLITSSLVIGLHRVGSWILLLHDLVDVFLYTSKFFKDSKWEKSAAVCFIMFTLSYAWCRLYKYGSIVILSGMYFYGPKADLFKGTMKWFARYDPEAWRPFELSSRGMCLYGYCLSVYWAISLGQILLLLMHFYWFSLILRIVKNILTSRKLVDDIREKETQEEIPDVEEKKIK